MRPSSINPEQYDTFIEARNKQEMMNAVRAVPYTKDRRIQHCVVNRRKDGSCTKFVFRGFSSEWHFEKHLSKVIANIKRSPAHVWK